MDLNSTPSAERTHIGFFGMRNAGKSSVVNKFTGQQLAVVSDTKGTTTDPVYKAMELLPVGPVMIVDTPGFDDEGELGELRVKKTKEVLRKVDVAVLVVDGTVGLTECDKRVIQLFGQRKIPFVIAVNKLDLYEESEYNIFASSKEIKYNEQSSLKELNSNNIVSISAITGEGIDDLKQKVIEKCNVDKKEHYIVSDLVKEKDIVILVVPIDSAAPKGRIILPQQQTIRDLLDGGAITMVCTPDNLKLTIDAVDKKVALVITDSQAFKEVDKIVPKDIKLTSFSILMARYKGFLDTALEGTKAIDGVKDGDRILICEGCTHHRQCEDIGTVKIPNWLTKYTGKELKIDTCSGREYPEDLRGYALVIHCGACMLNEREVISRMNIAIDQNVPFTNYGIVIAKMNGILDRATEIFYN
ncbi:MAG: [FeFe] hydrogenase H-cluster maturation GTPase HydF [Lachnospiraceae bacterium]|nr:[FeFe] hydrogenase H-cluster maturation GTPase HydF [Lachnospiraceae bacterium]